MLRPLEGLLGGDAIFFSGVPVLVLSLLSLLLVVVVVLLWLLLWFGVGQFEAAEASVASEGN